MTFSPMEIDYLTTQRLGRLATLRADGAPQVSPVGFEYNAELDTIDIAGFGMSTSQKFRNAGRDERVAFVIDDVASLVPWRVRCLEIRGVAEAIPGASDSDADTAIIRVHPRRIISFGIDQPDQEPHELTPHNRNVG